MWTGRAGFGDLAPSLAFSNVTGGSNTVFKSGETWRVEITGPSNQKVWLVANGLEPIEMGETDANGRFAKQGTVGDGEIGTWGELWYVGPSMSTGAFLGAINFQVVAAPVSTGGGGADRSHTSVPVETMLPAVTLPTGIPLWGWLAGAGLALVLLSRK